MNQIYNHVLTKEFYETYYVQKRMSYNEISEMLRKNGHNISNATVFQYAKRLGYGRTLSEGIQNANLGTLDYSTSFINEDTIDAIDGFLLGDGNIQASDNALAARCRCSLKYEEFCNYMMSFFTQYLPTMAKYDQTSMQNGYVWIGSTKFHPDLMVQHKRWYTGTEGKKIAPSDVRLTPKSVMLWYLGDGSIVQENNSIQLRISTDDFPSENVDMLAVKLSEKGILSHRNNDNRIMIEARGVPAFFNFIGKASPVKCYEYKFDLPVWRLESKRMRDVAMELNIDYQKLAYWVKIGKVPCFRASENGKPRFMPEHIAAVKDFAKKQGCLLEETAATL